MSFPPGLNILEESRYGAMVAALNGDQCPMCGAALEPSCWAYPIVCCHHWNCIRMFTSESHAMQEALIEYMQHEGVERMVGRILCGKCAVCEQQFRGGGTICSRENCCMVWSSLLKVGIGKIVIAVCKARGG